MTKIEWLNSLFRKSYCLLSTVYSDNLTKIPFENPAVTISKAVPAEQRSKEELDKESPKKSQSDLSKIIECPETSKNECHNKQKRDSVRDRIKSKDVFSIRHIRPVNSYDRVEKVSKFWKKKYDMILNVKRKTLYMPRKKVAEKRLRVCGRFVTRKQAFEMLGLS